MNRRLILAAALAVSLVAPAFAEKLNIKTLQGKVTVIEINLGQTVEELMQKIADADGVDPAQQRLIYGGKQLEADKKLTDYGITDGAQVMLVLRVRSQ